MKLKPRQNNLFRGLNGPRSGIKRDMWVPLEKKKQTNIKVVDGRTKDGEDAEKILIFFSLLVSF